MFNDSLINSFKEQVSYLKAELQRKDAELKDMQDRFMALVGDAFQKYQTKDLMSKPVPPPSYVDSNGQVVRMEKEEDKQARKEALQILGH